MKGERKKKRKVKRNEEKFVFASNKLLAIYLKIINVKLVLYRSQSSAKDFFLYFGWRFDIPSLIAQSARAIKYTDCISAER